MTTESSIDSEKIKSRRQMNKAEDKRCVQSVQTMSRRRDIGRVTKDNHDLA